MFVNFTRKSLLAVFLSSMVFTAVAEDKKEDAKDEEKKKETLTEILEKKDAFEGFVDIYRDKKDGSGLVVFDESQLDTPFLYFVSTVDGAVAAGTFRGQFRGSRLIEFRRNYDRIEVVSKTPRFYFDPESAVSRAADANISEAILVSTKIEHEDEGKIAIDLSALFANEDLHRVAPMPSDNPQAEKRRFKPGKLSKDKTAISEVKNFPENTHVVVRYVYENSTPKVGGGAEISDARYTTLQVQHAFIKAPENNFQPRRDDARIGYFSQQFDDLTSDQTANYRDVINRWNLEKKDPSAEVSDPVEPIVWWIENTTPVEWRETIINATLAWNTSFEKAGISNAIQVKIQPDDAEWSADDVRYNVLRWTSSPRPPFGGYGPSISHPLTGQIIGSDIMLEYSFMKGRWIASEMFTDGYNALESSLHGDERMLCSLGHELNLGLMFGQYAGLADGMGKIEEDKLLRQSMSYLILHEVGHTLGLNHNMMASQLHGHDEAHDASITQGILAGSVMDYPSVNYAPVGKEQGDFYTEKPGPYDDWAILYGYSQALDDPEAEEKRLTAILNRSAEPELAFGNDADDMRSAGRHVDPRINIFDMSGEAVDYAQDRFELIKHMAGKLKDKTLVDGRSHNDLAVGVNVLFGEFARQASVVSRYIGGVYLNRAFVGQEGYTQPLTPVPESEQNKAMNTLMSFVFAPDAIEEMEPLFAYIQRQRRGFSGWGRDESPRLHDMLLGAQKNVLDHVLHPNVLIRLTDTTLYGNTFTAEKMMGRLTDAIFKADIKGDVNSYRRNLQVEYVDRLIAMSGLMKESKYDNFAQAASTYELGRVLDMVKKSRGDQATKIHKSFLRSKIQKAFYKG
ncbi:zinc-dependent metalloprotease [Alteromonas sp. W364]|uniref:zinc-dependent metalloprotease n=1 Tax=Alteromonas sp. W364 TaxID=3075610 RepID=UPI002886839E|nr:zinc-dependent metalloprotease [Alteromonas sp. W364]MDT0627704.1 zinc-dependent metalloprotease [Alteromonas sp. W364]